MSCLYKIRIVLIFNQSYYSIIVFVSKTSFDIWRTSLRWYIIRKIIQVLTHQFEYFGLTCMKDKNITLGKSNYYYSLINPSWKYLNTISFFGLFMCFSEEKIYFQPFFNESLYGFLAWRSKKDRIRWSVIKVLCVQNV